MPPSERIDTLSDLSPRDAIKKVGRGKTLSQDLGYSEARSAFGHLLAGHFTAAQAGAFLQALRIKELTQEELNALLDAACARLAPPADARLEAPSLVINLASDTGRKGGLLSVLAAQVLDFQGRTAVLLRSTPLISGNAGSFSGSTALGQWSSQSRFELLDDWLPGWDNLADCRRELGFRSCLHTVEKLVNPWPAAPMVLGISHMHYAERLAAAMRHRGLFGAIILGNHGTTDLVLHKATEIMKVTPQGHSLVSWPESLGGGKPDPGIYSLARFADWTHEVEGKMSSGFRDALALQTACLAWCSGSEQNPDALLQESIQWVHAWSEAK